ncbi:Sel1 repeat protein [compost metagenome]
MRTRHVLISLALLGMLNTAQAGFDEDLAAHQRGEFPSSLGELQPLAEQGNAYAQYQLGLRYHSGSETPKDDGEAARWYRRAAEQGAAEAQECLGYAYYRGQGVPVDYREALKWFRLAAEQGNARAQAWLGVLYQHGNGVPKNLVVAYALFNRAAAADDPLDRGLGLQNLEEVAVWMTPQQIEAGRALSRTMSASPLNSIDAYLVPTKH